VRVEVVELSVNARWLGGCRTLCTDLWGDHELHCDEPASIGGTNHGPSPFSLLEMALANCTITTIWRVARDKGIGLATIEVDVSYKPNRTDETAESSYLVTCDLRMTDIRRRILVGGDFDDDALEAMLWGAEHCPVSNTIAAASRSRPR
jgi:putative redox protein